MACHKFASNVCEKAMIFGDSDGRKAIIEELMGPALRPDGLTPIGLLMKDQYGNYVLQRALAVAEGEQKEALTNAIRPQLATMRKTCCLQQTSCLYRTGIAETRAQARLCRCFYPSSGPWLFFLLVLAVIKRPFYEKDYKSTSALNRHLSNCSSKAQGQQENVRAVVAHDADLAAIREAEEAAQAQIQAQCAWPFSLWPINRRPYFERGGALDSQTGDQTFTDRLYGEEAGQELSQLEIEQLQENSVKMNALLSICVESWSVTRRG
ncbi:PUM-HD domain-containing protein [Mycena indigotica]|uniref:PUM-HD domain-containing protein n=1 Tax=Mycena indigotica TaxID=2126181 RepID=A0A8H6SFS7_9AGAR|nr:PUM-HD domain-containing protein [Mycena indigotica]KAF7298594.1 PUM-HD domain-containing protein [Mycena indigotica]